MPAAPAKADDVAVDTEISSASENSTVNAAERAEWFATTGKDRYTDAQRERAFGAAGVVDDGLLDLLAGANMEARGSGSLPGGFPRLWAGANGTAHVRRGSRIRENSGRRGSHPEIRRKA
jgi:hypothetical protein